MHTHNKTVDVTGVRIGRPGGVADAADQMLPVPRGLPQPRRSSKDDAPLPLPLLLRHQRRPRGTTRTCSN